MYACTTDNEQIVGIHREEEKERRDKKIEWIAGVIVEERQRSSEVLVGKTQKWCRYRALMTCDIIYVYVYKAMGHAVYNWISVLPFCQLDSAAISFSFPLCFSLSVYYCPLLLMWVTGVITLSLAKSPNLFRKASSDAEECTWGVWPDAMVDAHTAQRTHFSRQQTYFASCLSRRGHCVVRIHPEKERKLAMCQKTDGVYEMPLEIGLVLFVFIGVHSHSNGTFRWIATPISSFHSI